MTPDDIEEIKLLAVRLGLHDFGIDMMAVREIRGWSEPTPLPQAPHYMHGMVQLRGAVIPVIDLRARLGLGTTSPTATSVLVVVESRQQPVGLLVDSVSDLVVLPRGDLRPAPHMDDSPSNAFIAAIAMFEGRILSTIWLDNVIPEHISEATGPPPERFPEYRAEACEP